MDTMPMIDVAGTGRRIGDAIRASGRSVRDVAAYLGMGDSTSGVYKYIRGDVLPSTDRLLGLSMLLGVTVNDLLAVA